MLYSTLLTASKFVCLIFVIISNTSICLALITYDAVYCSSQQGLLVTHMLYLAGVMACKILMPGAAWVMVKGIDASLWRRHTIQLSIKRG